MPSTTEPTDQLPTGYDLLGLITPTVEENEPDRAFAPVDEATIRLLRRETRIGLARGTVTPVEADDPATQVYDIPLMCVVQTHPECAVRWSRLVLDLSPTPGATIVDMAPALVEGTTPMEIETTLGADLGFDVVGSVLTAQATPRSCDAVRSTAPASPPPASASPRPTGTSGPRTRNSSTSTRS